MGKRLVIENLTYRAPVAHVLIEECDEAFAMIWYKKMQCFVEENVLQTLQRFFSQLKVETDVSLLRVAASPSGFHPLQIDMVDLDPENFFPLCRERLECPSRFAPIQLI